MTPQGSVRKSTLLVLRVSLNSEERGASESRRDDLCEIKVGVRDDALFPKEGFFR